MFNNLYGLCPVLLQVIFLLIIWIIFFRPEKEKKAVVSAGIFAAVNVVLYLFPAVPTWGRYAVSAALVLGYSRIKYGRHLEKAVKSGIAFRVKFDYRETDTISAFDMGIVLNNLLDNAIEACENLEQAKRRIILTLKRKNHFLLIEVENSFDGKMEWKDGEAVPATMKQSSLPDVLMEHGIGLKDVKDVADRYLGYMDIKAGRDVFKVTVMFQQKEI